MTYMKDTYKLYAKWFDPVIGWPFFIVIPSGLKERKGGTPVGELPRIIQHAITITGRLCILISGSMLGASDKVPMKKPVLIWIESRPQWQKCMELRYSQLLLQVQNNVYDAIFFKRENPGVYTTELGLKWAVYCCIRGFISRRLCI